MRSAEAKSHVVERDRLIRIVLVAALAFSALAAVAEAYASFNAVRHDSGRSWRQSETDVIRGQHLNPAVFMRISALVPASAAYTVSIRPGLGNTVNGQAFAALLRSWLLPRLQVPTHHARWHVIWGEPVPACCRTWSVGRVYPDEPPVVVVSDG